MREPLLCMLSWQHPSFSIACLQSYFKYTDKKYKLVIVDNGSSPQTIHELNNEIIRGKSLGFDIELILNGKNLGISAAINIAMKMALEQDKDFCFLSNDVILGYNWLTNLRNGVYKYKEVFGASPYISPEATYDDYLDQNFRDFYRNNYKPQLREDLPVEKLWEMTNTLYGGDWDLFSKNWSETRSSIPPLYEWFSMVFYLKKEVLEQVGFMDPNLTPSNFEDLDLMVRMNNKQMYRISVTDSIVHHFGSISNRNEFHDDDPEYREEMRKNETRFHTKWKIFLPYDQQNHRIPDGDKYPSAKLGPYLQEFFPISDIEHSRHHDAWYLWEPEKYPEIPQPGNDKWKQIFGE